MIEQRHVSGKPAPSHRQRFVFDRWIRELDEPSRARFERILEVATEAIAYGKGGADAVPRAR
jgi:hypothetical protein